MGIMVHFAKYFSLAITAALCATSMVGCTYRQPGIDEREAATIKGYFLEYRANYIFPFFWPESIQIIVGDEEILRENIQELIKNSAEEALVEPGYRCIVAQISPVFGSYHTCPICFNAKSSDTYQVRVHWGYRWPELYGIDHIDVVEESSGRIVAEQQKFCKGPLCCLDCSECPAYQPPDQDGPD